MFYDIVFSPDGMSLVSGGEDDIIQVWDVETGELRFRPILHFGDVTALAFSPDGSIFASGSRSGDDAVYLWDSQTGEAVHTFVGHALYVTDLAFSPDVRRWRAVVTMARFCCGT